MSSKRENFYRRGPSKALSGMIGLSLEERGVYNTIIDLLYSTWRPLEDNRAYIAGWCGCAVQKVNPIINRLIEKGRLITFTEGARTFLSDEAFEAERTAVKGPGKTRSGRGEVREKSAGVGEKSAGVEQNHRLLDTDNEQNQSVEALDKRREEKKEAKASSVGPASPSPTVALFDLEDTTPPDKPKAEPWDRDADFAALWIGATPTMRKRAKSKGKVWPQWRAARAKADGGAAIVEALARYRAGDPDVGRTGGPGLHLWLQDGTWELWLEPDATVTGPAVATFSGPPGLRAAVVAAKGEAFAVGYLDPCGWSEGPPRRLTTRNKFVADQILKAVGAQLAKAGIEVTIQQEQAA